MKVHLDKLRIDPGYRESYIRQLAVDRMAENEDCYPFSCDNFEEALTNLPDHQVQQLCNLMKNGTADASGIMLRAVVQGYWIRMAIHLSTVEVGNAKN